MHFAPLPLEDYKDEMIGVSNDYTEGFSNLINPKIRKHQKKIVSYRHQNLICCFHFFAALMEVIQLSWHFYREGFNAQISLMLFHCFHFL